MLTVKDLIFQYNSKTHFKFPNFTLSESEKLLVLGQSGCGKTTLLHLLAGILSPQSGNIQLGNTSLHKLSNTKRDRFRGEHIGIVYQKTYFVEALNVLDNLLLSPFTNSKQEAKKLAEQLNIIHLLTKLPQELSVGEQQRVSIARALMIKPKLILADEPTSALDEKNCFAVLDLLTTQAKAHKAMLIIVTHDQRLMQVISHQLQLDDV